MAHTNSTGPDWPWISSPQWQWESSGATPSLRQWYAGLAMQALLTGCSGSLSGEFSAYAKGPCNSAIADRAFEMADEMINRGKR